MFTVGFNKNQLMYACCAYRAGKFCLHVLWMSLCACCVKITCSLHLDVVFDPAEMRWERVFFSVFHSGEIICLSGLKTIAVYLKTGETMGMGQHPKRMPYYASFRSIWICVLIGLWRLRLVVFFFLRSSKVPVWCDCVELTSPGATVFIWSSLNLLIISKQSEDWFSWKLG